MDNVLHPPTGLRENLDLRIKLADLGKADEEAAAQIIALASKDIVWCFNVMLWTYDPRPEAKINDLPFILYDYQKEFILELQKRLENDFEGVRDLLVDKSRDMGVTWCILGWLLWNWRFSKSFHALVGTYKEQLIDKQGDMDTHFERLRWMISRLPTWFLPQGYVEPKHNTFLQIKNPANGNTINGQAVTDDFSRQGRRSVVWVDEFAFCDHAEGAWKAMGDTTRMRVATGTPDGMGNKFANLRFSGSIPVLTYHWTQHPYKAKGAYFLNTDKTKVPIPDCATANRLWKEGKTKVRSPWYDLECERRKDDPESVLQELDINYLSSGLVYFPHDRLDSQFGQEPKQIGHFVDGSFNKPEFREGEGDCVYLYHLPDPEEEYVIGTDTSEGIGRDHSASVLLNKRLNRVDAIIKGHLDNDTLVYQTYFLAMYYNKAIVAPERNGVGYATLSGLLEIYGNIFQQEVNDHKTKKRVRRPGWVTNSRTKPLMMELMKKEVKLRSCELIDPSLIQQCRTIVKQDGKIEAAEGYHDDLVIARAIAGYVRAILPYTSTSQQVALQRQSNPEIQGYGSHRRAKLGVK